MKKTVALFISVCLVVCLSACNISNLIEATKKDDVVVTVVEKKNIPKNTSEGRYSDRVEFVFNVENLTEKTIKGIQGELIIEDMFNNEIISISCDFTGKTILGNSTTTYENIGIDINQFMDSNTKLYNESFENLKFTYKTSNIIYSDEYSSSNQEEETENTTSDKVKVEVTNKHNLDKDYNVGRYSSRVEFDFKVTNVSSKTIKGVQGTLVVMDLFGEDIISIDTDFTGQNISPNNYIIVSDLGIDINQFMDHHIKLYNEKFEDLNFEYNIKSIVYTDGTTENFN